MWVGAGAIRLLRAVCERGAVLLPTNTKTSSHRLRGPSYRRLLMHASAPQHQVPPAAGDSERLAALTKGERPSSMPRVIYCDMDGTLLTDQHQLTARTIASLERYRVAGGIIVFTTGRSITSLKSVCATAGFWPDVCVGTQGTTVFRPPDAPVDSRFDGWLELGSEVPFHIESGQAVDFLQTFMDRIPNCHAWVDFPDDGAVADSATEVAAVLDAFRPGFSAHYPHRTAQPSLSAEILASGESIPGLGLWVRGFGLSEISAAMASACKDDAQRDLLATAYKTAPMGVNCVDGTSVAILCNKLAGKDGTLRWICERLGDGYEPAAVAAFGDGTNDVAMFAAAGWSCAPANGEAEARENATAVSVLTHADEPMNFCAAQLDAFVQQHHS